MIKKIFVILFLSINSIMLSLNISSNAVTGNWNATTSWAGGIVPTGNDSVIIVNGSIITLNIASAQIFHLQINSTGILSCSSNTLSLFGKFVNNGTFNANTGTVRFNGFVFKQPILGTSITTFNNMIVNNTNGTNAYGVTAHPLETRFVGNIITNGVFNRNCTGSPTAFCHFMGTSVLTGTNSLILHHVTIDATATVNHQTPNIYITGNWLNNGTFIPNTNTINFDYTSCSTTTQSVNNGTSDFYNVRSAKTSTFTVIMNNNTRVQNNFTNVLGIWSSQTFSLNVGGNFINSGVYSAGTGLVFLNGLANQNIDMGGSTLYNFKINKTGGSVYALSIVEVTNSANLLNGIFYSHPNVSNPTVYELYINNNNPATTLTGYSANSFVIGRLRRQVTAGVNTYNFPIGPMNVSPVKYRPITHIQTNSGGASNVSMIGDSISFQGNKANWYVRIGSNAGNPVGNFLFTYNLVTDFPAGMPECAIMALRGAQPPPANWTYVLNTIVAPTGAASGSITTAIPAALAPNSFILGEATPVVSGATICSGKTTTLTITSPTGFVQFDWWNSASSGSTVQTNNTTYSTPSLTTNTTYYIQTTASSCAGLRTPVTVTVNTTPSATINMTNSITCTNTTAAVSITSTNTPISILWNGPSISGSTTTPSTTVSQGGTYSVTITYTATGCSQAYSVFVPTNTLAVAASASLAPTASITCGTTSLTLVSNPTTPSDYSYSWTGPGILSGATTSNPIVNSGGNYSVVVTNTITGCSGATGTATVFVPTNTTTPSLSLSAASLTTTCGNPTTTVTATSNSDPNTTYTWTAPGSGTIDNVSISTPNIGGTGVFTVVITNIVNGCLSAAGTVTLTQDINTPTYNLGSNTATITCAVPNPSVSLTSTVTGVTYSWNPTPSSGIITASPTFTAAGNYTCIITNTVNGCTTNAAQVNVGIDIVAPTVSVTPSVSITCSSNNTVAVTSTVNPAFTYTWSGPGIQGSVNDYSITANAIGDYSLTVTNPVNGCTNTAISSVGTNTTAPTLTITSTSTVITCSVNSSTLTATSTLTDSIIWDIPGGGTATSSVIATTAGDYTATIVDAINSCKTSTTITISSNIILPDANAGAAVVLPCSLPSAILSGTSTTTDPVSYSWFGPTIGSVTTGSDTPTPTVNSVGVYTLVVTNLATGCMQTATVNVTQDNVVAAFISDFTTGDAPLTVNFTNGSSSSSGSVLSYSWTLGNGILSNFINPNTIYNVAGTYTVVLIASSATCSDTTSKIIIVEDGFTIEIPNVFTPNGDGANDAFHIKTTGVKSAQGYIYNRWGQLLHSWDALNTSWDGKASNGENCPDATYYYLIKVIDKKDKEHIAPGYVLIIR
jgi:gliding motility-associated-like protein